MNKELIKKLPKVNALLDIPKINKFAKEMPYTKYISTIRTTIDTYRNFVVKDMIEDFSFEDVVDTCIANLRDQPRYNLTKVINASGTIIHTNLGRSLLSEDAMKHVVNIGLNYNNLEYNLDAEGRGSRYDHVEQLICELTGAEAAVVVNNNASAVLLTLISTVTNGEVVISRGELIEIGGSFRVPEIMNYANTKLVEVGTTNRTHLKDYANAIGENTKALIKVHTSNYKIVGFTKEVSLQEMVDLAKENNVLSIEDAGSGNLINLQKYTNLNEPTIQDSIKTGVDLVTFSGDKLLGGAQAGIIIGKKEYINEIKKNNLLRSLRVSKLTLAALEVTLNHYKEESEVIKKIPSMRMICEDPKEVQKRARSLRSKLNKLCNHQFELIKTDATIGGGAMPTSTVESYGLRVTSNLKTTQLKKLMHQYKTPIIPITSDDKIVIDLKTIRRDEFKAIIEFFEGLE